MATNVADQPEQHPARPPANRSLANAKSAKQDEFYTQYINIQKEIEAYLEFDPNTFRNKVVYCNCDDPFESNFFKFFAANFNRLGLKKLITTSYDGSPIAGQGTLFPEYDEGDGSRNSCWFSTLDHGRRHQPLPLMTIADNIKFSKHKEILGIGYETYCNFDALEVPFTDAIPSDFDGIMGVPISFLDKYDPDQFEIIANGDDRDEMEALGVPPLGPEYVGNAGRRKVGVPSTKKAAFKRIFIRHRRVTKGVTK